MTCDEYLSMLSTVSVDELVAPTDHDHAARCPDCDRVTRLVVAREQSRVAAFEGLASSIPTRVVNDVALATAHERRIDRIYATGIAIALAGAAWFAATRIHFADRAAVATVEEAVMVRCLSASQAMDLMRPYLGAHGLVIANDRSPGVITIRATPTELRQVHAMLDRYERPGSPACTPAPLPTPTP